MNYNFTDYSGIEGFNFKLNSTANALRWDSPAAQFNMSGIDPRTNGNKVTYEFDLPVDNFKFWVGDLDALENVNVNFYDKNGNRITDLLSHSSVVAEVVAGSTTLTTDATYGVKISTTRNANSNGNLNYVEIYVPNVQISKVEATFVGTTNNTPEYHIGNMCTKQDTDGDRIPDYLDLDSDNDSCLDAIEGDENVTPAMLVAAGGTVTVGTGSTASNRNLCANGTCIDAQGVPTVVNTGGAADIGSDQGQGTGFSASALMNECDNNSGDCTKPGATGTPLPTKVGILTKATKADGWPENVPNGHIVLDGAEKGFVITHMTTAQRDLLVPVEGMMIYNTSLSCVQLYRGASPTVEPGRTGWNCIEQNCDGAIASRNVNIGWWSTSGFNFANNHGSFLSQLNNAANYGSTGTFKGITGFTFTNATTDINATAAAFSAAQLKAKYDMIVTGWQEMTAASAAKIKAYTDLGGVVFVLMDFTVGDNLNAAFGGTGSVAGTNSPWAYSGVLNNTISNGLFGNSGGAIIQGSENGATPVVGNIPPGAFILGYLNNPYNSSTILGTANASVYVTGEKGRAIFVHDEGIFRFTTVSGTVIDTPQEIFIHNLMSYGLQKVGFSPQ